jgi:hypothetical protein
MLRMYNTALLLYKTYNDKIPRDDQISLNFDQQIASRQTTLMTHRSNKLIVGINAVSKRFCVLNCKILQLWLNESYEKYKLNCKNFAVPYIMT